MTTQTDQARVSNLSQKQERIARLTATPAGFAVLASEGKFKTPKHIRLLNRKLFQLATGQIQRLIIQMPPRHGKSELCSKYFPAWFVGSFPEHRIGICSYESGFASSWGEKARALIHEFGPSIFGVQVAHGSKAKHNWTLAGHNGGMNTAGIGGPLTGRGFRILGVDDPVKNAEEALSPAFRAAHWDWWNSTAATRIEPGGGVFVMMTRWHEEDLIGQILKRAAETGDKWDVVSVPALAEHDDPLGRAPGEALWPERYSKEALELTRRNLDPFWWASLYQQNPGSHGRTEWPASYFGPHIMTQQVPHNAGPRVVTLDPSKGRDAKKGDYSAIVGIAPTGGKIHVRSDIRRRPIEEMVSDLIDFAVEFNADAVGIEANQFQELLVDIMQRQTTERNMVPLPIYTINNKVKKEIRIRRLSPYLARGEMLFEESASNQLLIDQLKQFPLGQHDDGPDSLEMALRVGLELSGVTISDDRLGHNLLEALR